jgi:uncharacterized protein
MDITMSNLNLVRGVYEAFGRGDVPAVLGMMDENIVWTEAEGFPWGGSHRGPDAVLHDVFMKIMEAWEGFQATAEEYIDDGNTVVAVGQYSGTYKETGKEVRLPFATLWRINNGKVIEFRQFTDTMAVHRG